MSFAVLLWIPVRCPVSRGLRGWPGQPGHAAPVSLSFSAVVLRRALPAVPTCGRSYSSPRISLLLWHLPLVDVYIKPLLSIICLFSLFKIGQKLDAISAVDILPGKIIHLCVNFLLGFQSIKIERAKGDRIGETTVFKLFFLVIRFTPSWNIFLAVLFFVCLVFVGVFFVRLFVSFLKWSLNSVFIWLSPLLYYLYQNTPLNPCCVPVKEHFALCHATVPASSRSSGCLHSFSFRCLFHSSGC